MATRYVKTASELPKVGTQCPACGQGFIRKSKFGGVWCPMCKTAWKIEEQKKKNTGYTQLQEINKLIREIYIMVGYIYKYVKNKNES